MTLLGAVLSCTGAFWLMRARVIAFVETMATPFGGVYVVVMVTLRARPMRARLALLVKLQVMLTLPAFVIVSDEAQTVSIERLARLVEEVVPT